MILLNPMLKSLQVWRTPNHPIFSNFLPTVLNLIQVIKTRIFKLRNGNKLGAALQSFVSFIKCFGLSVSDSEL